MSTRVGIGYDSHRFSAGRPLRLGGVTIPHTHGLAGHSDGDVALHAMVDALLGAVAHQRRIAARTEREREGIEQDRFAGAGFAG